MKTKLVLAAVAAAVAVFSQGAFAQASSPSRAEVKAETKSAEKAGALTPAGQGPGAMGKQPSTASDKTRDERKMQTKSDIKAGATSPAGEASEMKMDKADKAKGTDKTRAERKAQTKADVKSGKTQPAGEAAGPSSDKPMK